MAFSGSGEVSGRRVQALGGWINGRRVGRGTVGGGWGRGSVEQWDKIEWCNERRVVQWKEVAVGHVVILLFHPLNRPIFTQHPTFPHSTY